MSLTKKIKEYFSPKNMFGDKSVKEFIIGILETGSLAIFAIIGVSLMVIFNLSPIFYFPIFLVATIAWHIFYKLYLNKKIKTSVK